MKKTEDAPLLPAASGSGSTALRWLSLLIVTLGCSISLMSTTAWQVIQPMLLDDGIFQCAAPNQQVAYQTAIDKLDSIGSGCLGLHQAIGFFIGPIFDRFGPRVTCTSGALLSAISMLVMALSLQFPCQFSGGMYASVLLTCTSAAQQYATYVWLWLLPEHPFLVGTVANTAYAVSSLYAAIAVDYHQAGSDGALTAHAFFYGMAALTLVSSLSCWVILPPRAQFRMIQAAVASKKFADAPPLLASKHASEASRLAGIPFQEWGEVCLCVRCSQCLGLNGHQVSGLPAKGTAYTSFCCMSSTPFEAQPAAAEVEVQEAQLLRDVHTLVFRVLGCGFGWWLAHLFALYMVQAILVLGQYDYYVETFGESRYCTCICSTLLLILQ